MPQKDIARGEIKKLLKEIPPEEFANQGSEASSILCSSPVWSRYATVFLFLSMNSEIDTLSLLEAAIKEGKKVFAPGIKTEKLAFLPIHSTEGPWEKGPYGIRQPIESSSGGESVKPEDFPALIITPGIAFDREGNRLGKGKGYYDRFFAELDAQNLKYTALGFCMDFQVIDRVPSEENDKKMDFILTKDELLHTREDKQWEK
jgi:5-formyltetrahydrofolate cyclo-ligase